MPSVSNLLRKKLAITQKSMKLKKKITDRDKYNKLQNLIS